MKLFKTIHHRKRKRWTVKKVVCTWVRNTNLEREIMVSDSIRARSVMRLDECGTELRRAVYRTEGTGALEWQPWDLEHVAHGAKLGLDWSRDAG